MSARPPPSTITTCRWSRAPARGTLATFYFDSKSGLLVRLVRYADSRVGRLPTQFDYADYRDVSGVKMPFRWKMTWLDGFEDVTLTEIQPNVPIDATKFAKPRMSVRRERRTSAGLIVPLTPLSHS